MNTEITRKKRILSVLLTVILVLSTVPVSVFAQEPAVESEVPSKLSAQTQTEEPAAPLEETNGASTEIPKQTPVKAPTENGQSIVLYADDCAHNHIDSNGHCLDCDTDFAVMVIPAAGPKHYDYQTLPEALSVWQDDSKQIVLLSDVTLTADDELYSIGSVNLDLQGKQISGDGVFHVGLMETNQPTSGYLSFSGPGTVAAQVKVSDLGQLEVHGNVALSRYLPVYGSLLVDGDAAKFADVMIGHSTGSLTVTGNASFAALTLEEGIKAVQLSGGNYTMISAATSVKAGELLAEGYAFCTFDGTEFIMYETSGTDLSVLGALTVVFCPHTTTDEDGNCRICKTQIYVAEVIKADGTATEYEVFADAWIAAIDNEGSTLKLLCDITLNKAENGILAQSGKFTVDLNGKTVSGDITQQLLTVSDTADITI